MLPARFEVADRICEATLASEADREWARRAVLLLEADQKRSADTNLLRLDLPGLADISIYLKDESTHPTGSLKHRLARSLFLYAICNGKVRSDTPIVEASSGSTAVSEAYFAKLLGLPFHAMVPAGTSRDKIGAIEHYGGRCSFVNEPTTIYSQASDLARRLDGVFLDQFTFAERATDWRGNNNIAESIFEQMFHEEHAVPAWIVMGAGTGGTASTIGRYIRYRHLATRLCVVDVDHSVFYQAYSSKNPNLECRGASRIEGIGRPRVEPSFLPDVIDHMVKVPDAASLAAMRVLSRLLGRRVGGSTGTNFFGVCWLANRMKQLNQEGSIVTLICDGGERYLHTYYSDAWIDRQGLDDFREFQGAIEAFLTGDVFALHGESAAQFAD